MAESRIKTAVRGYNKDEVHKYILKMSENAEAEMQKYIKEIEACREEISRLKKKIKDKDAIIRACKEAGYDGKYK